MGKYLDKTGLQHFYDKLKEKFADKTTIENKLNSLTGALTWKGELSSLPAVTNYSAGNVIKVGKKEYVLTESNGTKTWDELGDEGSYLLKTTAEETYLKKAEGAKLAESNSFSGYNAFTGYVNMAGIDFSGSTKTLKAWNGVTLDFSTKDTYFGSGLYIGYKGTTNTVQLNSNYRSVPNDNALTLTNASSTEKPVGISNVAEPIEDTDAANKKYVDDKVAGVTITDGSITKAKLDSSVQTSLGKADNSLQIGATNTQTKQTAITTESTSTNNWGIGFRVQNSSTGTEIVPNGITFAAQEYTPMGIYRDSSRSLTLKLESAAGPNVKLTGLGDPTNDTDAANKKYVDNKTSGTVKICQTNEPVSGHEQRTTFPVNAAGYGGLKVTGTGANKVTEITGAHILIGSMNPSGDGANYLSNRAVHFGTVTKTFGEIKVNSNNKLQITGLDTPTSDTDAANKAYVDGKVSGKVDKTTITNAFCSIKLDFDNPEANIASIKSYTDNLKTLGVDISKGYVAPCYWSDGTSSGISFYDTDSGILVVFYRYVSEYKTFIINASGQKIDEMDFIGQYELDNAIGDVKSSLLEYVDKSTLATSLQAITIYTDNTAEHKAANLANIKAYEDNLKAMGVDVTKGYTIPFRSSGATGIISPIATGGYGGTAHYSNTTVFYQITVDSDGNYKYAGVFTFSGNYSELETTNKGIFAAINEVNALAKSKASTAVATTSANGLMSSSDKKKLDGVLDAIANNASVNAMDIVSYDEQTGTYSGNAINLNGNDIKTESAITVSGVTIAANTTMDDALKTVLTRAEKAVSDATYARDYGIREINGVNNSVVNFATSVSEPGDVEFNVTSNDGTTTDITAKVNGLGSAAYRDENYFATSSQGFAADSALQSVTAGGDEYINATVEKKDGTSQRINVSASVSTNISDTTTTGEYLADAYAVKQYVDSKAAGGSDMITFIYDDDSGALTTTAITDAQYKTITDAIKAGVNPNIQAAYITDGEYNYMPLCYQFDDGYYFGSIYCDSTSIRYTKIFCVNAVIDYASNNGKHSVNVTYNGTDFDSLIINIAKEVNTGTITISSTSGNANLPNKSGKYAITATTGSYTLTLPSSPSDGVTYEIYKYNSTHSLTISSGSTNIYVCELASTVKNKTYSSRSGKITIAYFASQSKWVVMRTDFGQ